MSNIKHKINPYTENMIIPRKGKQVSVTRLGQDGNVLINQHTGEVHGTHVVTYKQVDNAEFVKLFTANIALTFDLTSAGIKAFNVLLFAVQYEAINKDLVYIDETALSAFLNANKTVKALSIKTLYRGINELIKYQIIAKSMRAGAYFINPSFVFNGDRIAFTTSIERRKTLGHDSDEQQELPLELGC